MAEIKQVENEDAPKLTVWRVVVLSVSIIALVVAIHSNYKAKQALKDAQEWSRQWHKH